MSYLAGRAPRRALTLALHGALLSMSCAAAAQQADRAGQAAPAAPPEAKAQSTTLETVTVTALKRRENEREVPAAISVVGEQLLESQHVTQLSDLQGYLPAMTIRDGGTPGQTSVSLRGIPTIGSAAVVGTYIDDTPLGSSSSFARAGSFVLDLLPYDVQRVEVLRGPQGTLYGAGAMGGLLKYVLKDPDLDSFEGRAGLGLSSVRGAGEPGWNARAGINAPLVEGKLALRASIAQETTPGWIDNAREGRRGINDARQRGIHASLLWQPNEDARLKLTALRQTVDADDNSLEPLTTALTPRYGRDRTGKPVRETFEKTVDYFAATWNQDLGWADLVSATGYSKTDTDQVNDQTLVYGPLFPRLYGAPPGVSRFPLTLKLSKWSQELRLTSKSGGKLEWMLGGFYTREQSDNRQIVDARTPDGVPLAGAEPLAVIDLPSTYREAALFGNLTYQFHPRLDATLGLRYARNDQDFAQIVSAGKLLPLGRSTGRSSENVTTYLLGTRWRLDEDNMLYLRVASGYRPGGPNFAVPGVPPSVDSDTLVSYEIGWKALLLDRRASIDLAAYRIDWKDIQLSASKNGLSYRANGGDARSSGVELTTAFKLGPSLRVGFNASYTDAWLVDAAPSIGGRVGDTLPGIPLWTGALTADYEFVLPRGMSGHVGGGYRWTGARMTNVDGNRDSAALAAGGQFDLNADVSKGRWTLRAYVRNLADSRDFTALAPVRSAATGTVSEWQGNRLQPRTFGLEFDLWF